MKKPVLLLLGVLAFPSWGGTQEIVVKTLLNTDAARFNTAIPLPDQVLGMALGSRLVRYDEVIRYLETLAEASPRAKLVTYGQTHEGRNLVVLIVSSEANMARLDEIKAQTRAAADEQATIPDNLPVTFWLGHAIHGDETSGVDASLVTAYRLTAGQDAGTQNLLNNLVVLIDPIQNPDGRERFIAQLTTFGNLQATDNADDLAHTGVWPYGRGNHYLFDLNRDAFGLVHPETQGRTRAQLAWRPQVVVDAHEMGSDDTYLFGPSRGPYNPLMPPNIVPWSLRFGDDQAAAFDRYGWSYYTREWAEGFYPGYLDNWQNYRGAISILYEQSGYAGLDVRKSSGQLMTYQDAVTHQAVSASANLTTAAENRAALLNDWAAGLAELKRKQGPASAYLLTPGKHPDRFNRMIGLLHNHGIRMERATQQFKAKDAHDYWTGSAGDGQFPAGTIRVVVDQTANPVLNNLLAFHLAMDEPFLASERKSIEDGKGSRLYDMTAWNLPMLYGLNAWWTESVPKGTWEPVTAPDAAKGTLVTGRARYGYLFDGATDHAGALAGWLAQHGVKIRVARKALRFKEVDYAPGTFMIRGEENEKTLPDLLAKGAARYGVDIQPVDSARVHMGNDMGGQTYHLLKAPRIALPAGSGISASQYGAVWHMLDHDLKLKTSALELGNLRMYDLSKYNVIVMPPTRGGNLSAHKDQLSKWVEEGGTLITIGNAADMLLGEEPMTKAVPRNQVATSRTAPALGPGPATLEGYGLIGGQEAKEKERTATVLSPAALAFAPKDYNTFRFPEVPINLKAWVKPLLTPGADTKKQEAMLRQADRRQRGFLSSGSILSLKLNPDHWLAYGSGERMPLLYTGRDAWLANPGVEVAASFEDLPKLHLSGLLWPEGAGRLARTAWLTRERMGRGQIIVFTSDPIIRGFTLGTRRMLINAVILGPGLGTR